jgi:hypothetical protein
LAAAEALLKVDSYPPIDSLDQSDLVDDIGNEPRWPMSCTAIRGSFPDSFKPTQHLSSSRYLRDVDLNLVSRASSRYSSILCIGLLPMFL